MLHDALLTLDLPAREGPPLPTAILDGVERLLFTGRWRRRMATCALSSAIVLARCHDALRGRPGDEPITIDSDADELVGLTIGSEQWGEAPPPWAERLPTRWLTEPCDFRLRTCWDTDALHVSLLLRFTARHDPEVGALTGALRAIWRLPERGPGEPADLARGLEATFDDRGLAALHRLVAREGRRQSEQTLDALRARFTCDGHLRHRTVVPAGERVGELVAGMPARSVAVLPYIARAARAGRQWWPALGDDGVPGWLGRGHLVSSAEVADAV